jgi:hypothetical protein
MGVRVPFPSLLRGHDAQATKAGVTEAPPQLGQVRGGLHCQLCLEEGEVVRPPTATQTSLFT